jgi:hypothetical protein
MYNGTEFFDTDVFDPVENPCFICGEEITAEEWDERHESHEPDCLHDTDFDNWIECDCDLPTHPRCCCPPDNNDE